MRFQMILPSLAFVAYCWVSSGGCFSLASEPLDKPSTSESRSLRKEAADDAPTQKPTSQTGKSEKPGKGAKGSGTVKAGKTSDNSSPAAGATDWPGWLGPTGNGISSEKGLAHTFPESGPKILWRAKLGTGYSGIAVADGRVFTLFGEKGREYVVCLDAVTGDEQWKVDSDADFAEGRSFGPRAMPCVDGNRVYSLGASGQVLCLDVATGKKIWEANLLRDFGMRLHEEGFSPSPLIEGKQLILLAGTLALALDKATGKQLWKALDEPINHASPSIVTINGRRQLLVLTGRNLVGLSPANGDELWRHPQEAVNIATPVLGPDNQVFAGAAYGYGCQLVKVEGDTARQVYKNGVLASHHATPVLYEGHLYGFDDRVGILKCIEFATGEERWVSRDSGKGNLIIADGQIILINEEGVLMLAPVSPSRFQVKAKARLLKGICYTAPSLAKGKLYLRSDAEMICIQMKE